MTELDAELGPLIVELIDEFGTEVEYTYVGESVYDRETGKNVTKDLTRKIKSLPPEDYDGTTVGRSNGTIETGDKKFTFAAGSMRRKPSSDDRMKFDGETFTVFKTVTEYTGDERGYYEVQGRAS